MIGNEPRPVTPLDLPLVRRLIPQRLPLDMASALARGMPGLEDVLLSSVPLADLGAPTLVLRSGDGEYVGQFRQPADKTVAYLTFVAPDPQEGDLHHWAHLLDAVVFEAGKRGAHRINAEVPQDHVIFQAFRLAGFAVYSRQVILRRAPCPVSGGDPALVRPEEDQDAVAISTLHANTVPRLLQQVEPLPMPEWIGLVYEREGHVAGYLAVMQGKSGVVIRPYFHPEVYDQVAAIILSALTHLPRAGQLPVYLYARSYQDWLRDVLEQVEFRPWTHQALLVKDTLVRGERLEAVTLPGLEPNRLRPPVVNGPLPLHKFSLLLRQKDRQSRSKQNGKF